MHLPAEIEDNLGAIRSRGYETSLGENHPGIHGVSVALVASGDGEHPTAFGSISIAGPARRLSRHRLDELATPLQGVCLSLAPRVSAVLGPDPGRTFDAHDL
jgi:DNA-binding IclR family transcriptional regulator